MIAHQTFSCMQQVSPIWVREYWSSFTQRCHNILENFSEIRNTLDLTCLPENEHEAPCFPHFDEGNSSMDGFSSFFAVSKLNMTN
jgi:hypothetical protein